MKSILILVTAFVGLLTGRATAQFGQESLQKASSELFTRVEDGHVLAVVVTRIQPGYHLYHTELSDPEAVALPTTFTPSGAGIEWGAFVMPEPHVGEDPALGFSYEYHEGTVRSYGLGVLEGGDGSDVQVKIAGSTCDDKGCVPYGETLTSQGRGEDAWFEAFPEELLASLDGGGGHGADPAAGDDGWTPEFNKMRRADVHLEVHVDGRQVEARVEVALDEGYHLYHGPKLEDVGPNEPVAVPTEVLLQADGVTWGAPIFPRPHPYPGMDRDFNDIEVLVHEGRFTITVPGELQAGATLTAVEGEISGQTCDEMGCITYSQPFSWSVAGVAVDEGVEAPAGGPDVAGALLDGDTGAAGAATPGATTPGAAADETADGEVAPAGTDGAGPKRAPKEVKSLLAFLLEAVGWALVTLVMPCTYPMIPITISFFTKQAADREGSVLPLSLAYGAGIVLIFVLIGLVVGAPITRIAANPGFNLVIGGMFVFFALSLFGCINLNPPAFLMNAAGKASSTGGILGVFLMGLTLVVTSFTCTAPFVGTLLASGAELGPLRVALGMGVFGLTMATPFVLLSLFPSQVKKMPSAGSWMNTFKVFLGFVELAASLKFFSNADLGWQWSLLSKEVFLILWAGVFLVAAMYLFGKINLKGEEDGVIGPGRMVAGTATFVFALYSGFLAFGAKPDPLMGAFAPPYSSMPKPVAAPVPEGGLTYEIAPGGYKMVVDDYEAGIELALAEKKLALVNFTGHV